MQSIPRSHFLCLVFIWAAMHLLMFYQLGIRTLIDSDGYIKGADYLMANGRFIDIHHAFYATHVVLLGWSRVIFPDQIMPFLLFQCVLSGIAVLALYKASSRLFNTHWAGLLSGVLYLLWWDNIQWNSVAMTESLFASLSCLVIYFLCRFQNRRLDYGVVLPLLLLLFFTRPTGVILIVATFVFWLLYHWKYFTKNPGVKVMTLSLLAVVSIISGLLIFQHWDFTEQYRVGNIVTYMNGIEGQTLYYDELVVKPVNVVFPEGVDQPALKIIHFIVFNPGYFLKTAALKVGYLISFVRPYYSLYHNLFSLLWVGLIYLLTYIGFRSAKDVPIKVFVIAVVVFNCGLIAISTVDWDNRFYIPMEPGIVLLAGGGGAALYTRLAHHISLFRSLRGR